MAPAHAGSSGRATSRSVFYLDAQGRTRWRLVAANGRAVGRSPVGYPDRPSAERALRELAAAIDALPVSVQYGLTGTGWVWHIAGSSGGPVAASTRSYERNATCWLSYRRFVKILAAATPPD